MLDAQAQAAGGRKVVEMQLDSGEIVWLTPPSVFLTNAIRLKLESTFPDIETAAYQVELPDAVVPGEKVFAPGQENAYKAAVLTRANAIKTALADAYCAVALDLPAGRAVALERYRPALTTARQFANLPEDDWEAVANHFIIASLEDKRRVMSIAGMNLPIEEAEVHQGLLMFRVELRRDVRDGGQPDGISSAAVSSGDERAGAVEPQPVV